jgi:hypothetical protein
MGQKYNVMITVDGKIQNNCFNDLYRAYESMNIEFYHYMNKHNGIDNYLGIMENLIEFEHEVVFGYLLRRKKLITIK